MSAQAMENLLVLEIAELRDLEIRVEDAFRQYSATPGAASKIMVARAIVQLEEKSLNVEKMLAQMENSASSLENEQFQIPSAVAGQFMLQSAALQV